jgi:hypothetical protein
MGASVPITNEGPVSVVVVVVVEPIPVPLLQPASTSAAPNSATAIVAGKNFTSLFEFISVASSLSLSCKISKRSEARTDCDSLQGGQLKHQIKT